MKLRKVLSVILSLMILSSLIVVPVSAAKGAVVYQKSGDWTISGEHNYLTVGSELGLTAGNKYIIEFGVTSDNPSKWPSFMFDWRTYNNASKINLGWNNHLGLVGFFNDGSNDCVSITGATWSATVPRGGQAVDYDYSIVWDTATSKFDVTIDYLTASGTAGTITGSHTSASTFSSSDVLKFWSYSTAVIKDLTIYEYTSIYTTENGWDLPIANGYQAVEKADGSLELNHEVQFTPALEDGKKYSIKYYITGLDTGSEWTYQHRLALISGGVTLDGSLSYRQAGIWENGNEQKWVASGTEGEIEVIIDKATGEYEMYALGALSASGTFESTSDFTLKMYKWGGDAPYISNVTVTEIPKKVIYTEENGWTTGEATETADGKLEISEEILFKPTLETGKAYSIKFDVSGLETSSVDGWAYQFRTALIGGGTTVDGVLAYRMEGKWSITSTGATVADGTNGTNEIVVDTETKSWKAYALGNLSAEGTFDSLDDFTIKFYHWGSGSITVPHPYISNVTVTEIPKKVIYTEANGWTTGDAPETADGKLQLTGGVYYKPALEANKKYSIKFNVSGLETGDAWTYQFRLGLISGSTTLDGSLSYRQEGIWENGNESKWVASATDGEVEVIIDNLTGEYEMYAHGALSASGTFASTENFTLHMYKWGGNAPYISNVTVTEIKEKVVFTDESGWTTGNAVETDDGKLEISEEILFKPDLEANKKYSIKYQVSGLETSSVDGWAYQFRTALIGGASTVDGVLAYRMEGVWSITSNGATVARGTDGTNEIIVDTSDNSWEAYALGSLSQYGTFDSLDDFTIKFYHWGSGSITVPHPYISNVSVSEIVFDGTYHEQNFDQIETDFASWRGATVSEVRDTQPLQVWGGSLHTDGTNKYIKSGAMDIYPLSVTPKTDKYELSFDFKPEAATDPNGSNWEAIVMQWNLGSSNSESWHDMKIGTSAGANVSGTVSIDRLWIFGNEMVIDPNEWINVSAVYDCKSGEINASVTQGSTVVTGSAPFNYDASSLTGAPKITFEGLERNSVKYGGVYLDNVVIKVVGEDVAPILTADSIKLYAGDEVQKALDASAFTNKIEVVFGQVMWPADMTTDKIYVVDENGSKLSVDSVTTQFEDGSFILVYDDGFRANNTYTVVVEQVRNIEGVSTLEVYKKNFYIKSGVFAELISITQNGNIVDDFANIVDGSAKINVNYSNTRDDVPVIHVIVGYYKNGNLVLADYFEETPSAEVTSIAYELDYTIRTILEGYDEIQIMVWDGFDTLKPLSAPITL